jgi:hypothetical protein
MPASLTSGNTGQGRQLTVLLAVSAAGFTLPPMAPTPAQDPLRERYLDLVDDLMGIEGVTPPPGGRGFGRGSLRYHGKIFAMLVRGRLVLKLPAARVTALIAAGDGVAFDANKGTPMREWLSLDPASPRDWRELATEALEFARLSRAGAKPG